MTKVILNSGGMDSFFLALAVPDAAHVFVDVGQKYVDKELEAADIMCRRLDKELHVVAGSDFGKFEHESGIIPYRNAELILNAAQYGNEIYLGVIANEVNSDKSPEFFRAMEQVLNISHRPQYWTEGKGHRIHTPLGDRTKTQLIQALYRRVEMHGGDIYLRHWDTMMGTVSCYSESAGHCGRCPSCFKRWVALTVATGQDHGHLFDAHPARWYPLAYWEDKGYVAARIGEIRQAYKLANAV